MILSKFVRLKVTKPNVRFYRDKYNCKVGDVINVSIEDLTYGSSELIIVKCDICEQEKSLMYRKYLKNINRQGYYTCSSKCSTLKKKNTWLLNLGFDSPLKSPDIKNKVKETCNIKYGFDNPMQNNIIKNKVKETCMLVYGSNSYVESVSFVEKMNMLYNVDNPMQNIEINNNRIKTSFRFNNFGDIKYQGKYELDFLLLCNKNSIFVSRPKFSIKYKFNGIDKIYLPDFYIEDLNLVIEIKSKYFYNLNLEINEIKEESTVNLGYNYLLIIDKNYKEFKKILNI